MQIRVDLGTLPTLNVRIENAEGRQMRATLEGLAEAIGDASESSQIAAATRAVYGGSKRGLVEIGAGVPFALIREKGGAIRPKRPGGVLRFADGEFRPFAYQRGIGYIARASRRFGGIAGEAFHRYFGNLR
jgi:hypothetical protein